VDVSLSKQEGWSLLETLAVVAVLSLLLLLAVPSLQSWPREQRLQAQAKAFMHTLQWARSQALVLRQRVTVCTSVDARTCAHTGGWQQGWLVFEDANANASVDAGERILQRVNISSAAGFGTGNSLVSRYVSYQAEGRGQTLSGAFQAGTIRWCWPGVQTHWLVVLNALGQARLDQEQQASCP
jgi:type IV fimbrial biogenesis protein FimT